MLVRRYADGVIVFDPVDGRTYSYPPEEFAIVDVLCAMIQEGADNPDTLLAQALRESDLDPDLPDAQLGESSANLRQWVDLALRLSGR